MKKALINLFFAFFLIRRLKTLVIVLTFFLINPLFAASSTVQTFYVPITEEQIRTWEMGINAAANGNDVTTVVSITGTFNGTIIYYDQWEDGYEYDISNPTQSTTQIWGDSDTSNGAPPGCGAAACDVVNAGTIITLRNSVPANPRDRGNLFFDGRDKFSSTGQLVVTRAGWETAVGTVFAGASEVFDTRKWGTSYEIPAGINSLAGVTGSMFQYTAMSIMAKDDNTTVQIDTNADGAVDITTTLNQGETTYVTNVSQSATVVSSSPVQVNLLTGDVGTNYEGRWFSVIPTSQWSNSYYSPVSTQPNATNSVILYNPDPVSAITVNVTTSAGPQPPINIPARSIARFNLTGSAANFNTSGAPFYAIMTADYDNRAYEWGALLIPELDLTPSVVVGWAPGSDGTPPTQNDSPVWVTPVANTTVYVDYDGDPSTGALTDPLGNKYDVSYALTALQSQLITDADLDMTGARIYTVDNTRIAAAWGENSGAGVPGSPAMDLGTTVLPFPSLTAYKTASILGDYNGNGGLDPGEVILYTIRVHNSGIVPLTNINILDTLDADVTYVANSSYIGSSPISDDSLPNTRFPLDEGGYNIVVSPSQLLPGEDLYVTFQVTVNNPFPPGKTQVNNNVKVSSITNSEIFLNTQTELVQQGVLQTTKTSSATGLVIPGDTIDYTITVTNTSTTPQTGIRLSDPLPSGTTYVANSTTATGPRQKFVYDKFDKLLYTNNDGPESWSGNWTETDAGGGGSTGGNVQVTNGELRFTTNASAAYRIVDLSAAAGAFTYATLKFNYRTNPAVDATDSVVVEMSANGGGGPWTVLETFTGVTGPSYGSRIYDISGYISANTAVRFRVNAGYTAGEYFYSDNVEIRAVGASANVLDQFNAVAYTNNDGSLAWNAAWTETDALGGGAAAGNVSVAGNALQMTVVGSGAQRASNLTSYFIGHILKFNVGTLGGAVITDTAVVEISRDGIVPFTTLDTFAGAVAGARSYDISNYISPTTTVQFRITGGYAAIGRYFTVDNVEMKAGQQLPVTKDNVPAGVNPDLIDGVPADLVLPGDGFALAPNESLTVTYSVTVNDPPSVTQVINTVTVTDQEKAPTSTATVVDTVSNGGTIGDLVWLDTIANGIYDAGEPGLYNVRVWLDTNSNGIFDPGIDMETRTGTNGKYIFVRLPAGTYRVYIDNTTIPAGLVLTAGSNPSPPIVITAEEIVLNTDFGYANGNPAAAIIGNYVWSDADSDGIQDPGEAGLGSVTIALATGPGPDTVYGTPDDIIFSTTATNAFGTFLFTNVPPGTYVVIAGVGPDGIPGNADDDLSGYTPTIGPESVGSRVSSPITVAGGSSYLMIDYGFNSPSTYSISNMVWFDSDSDGAVDLGEPGIKDVTVNLVDASNNVIAATTSDVNGNFSFSGVPNGNYTIKIEDANGKLIGFAGTTAAALSKSLAVVVAGGNVSGASFGYYATGRIGDTLWRDPNGNGVQDTGEAGISGVTVDLYKDTNGDGLLDTATDQFLSTTTTDLDGNFMFQTSGGGRFFVSVPSGQAPLSGLVLTTTDDQAAAGYQRTIFLPTVYASDLSADFGFNPPGQIGHAVWNDLNSNGVIDTGEPGISGVIVKLYKDANGNGTFEPATDTLVSTTTTDSSGYYVFQATSTGTYFVDVDDTQTPVVLMTLTTSDDQAAAGVQLTVDVNDLNISYLTNNFGFYTPASDLGVTKVAVPAGDVYSGDTITYTITITNNSATTTQTGITVSDPLPANTAFVPGSTTATGFAYFTTATTLNAVKDTYLQQANPTRNYGATDPLSIRYSGTGAHRIPLVQFDLSTIPAGATVNSSNMQYYVSTANAALTVNLYRLTRNWNEGTSNNANCSAAAGNGATWNTYDCVNNWTTAGGDYDGATLLGSFVPTPVGAYQTVTSANLDSLVQSWINGSVANNGVILVPTAAATQTAAIRSRATAGQEPRITVNYTYVGAQVVTTGTPPNLVVPADGFILPPGQSMTVTYQVTVGSTPDITEIRNIATVSSSETQPRKAFVVNTMKYSSDLQVTKAIQSYSSPCYIGSCTVTYLITVSNIGTTLENSVEVTDLLPAELSWSSDTPSQGTYNPVTGIWNVGSIAAGNSATLTITANVTVKELTIQNCASLTASNPADSNATNNSSCASFYPTHVVISGFRTYEDRGQVVVEWSTSSETGTAGFYLFRLDEVSGEYHQLNSRLLPAILTSQQGGTYSLIDKGAYADRNNTYILVEVEGNGTKSFHGPYIVHVNGYKARGVISSNPADITNFFITATGSSNLSNSRSGSITTRNIDRDGTIIINIGNNRKTMRSVSDNSKTSTTVSSGTGNKQESMQSLSVGLVENFTRFQHSVPAEKIARLKARKPFKEIPQHTDTAPETFLKIAITQNGLYYISASDISRLFNISVQEANFLVQTRRLALSNKGNSISYLPDSSNSGIYFYGQGVDSIYTDENIYWLFRGEGTLMKILRGRVPPPVIPGTFTEKAHTEKDRFAVTALFRDPEADFWLWDYIVAGDPALGSKTFTVQADGAADVPSQATLAVNLNGFTNTEAALDHHVQISINGTVIGEDYWKGSEPRKVVLDFDQQLLFIGGNTVTVTGLLDTGAPYSIFYVDSFDLAYQRVHKAVDNSLGFDTEGNQAAAVTGFDSPEILVFDITDPGTPKFISDTTIDSEGTTYNVSFSTCSTDTPMRKVQRRGTYSCLPGTRFLAVTADSAFSVSRSWTVTQSNLSSTGNSADYLIITSPELLEFAGKLADYRSSQGMKTMVVRLEDIMDEFNYGISSPAAVRTFLGYAYRNWSKPPHYVLLAGKGTFDYKDNLGHGDNIIPPLQTATPWGLNPSDNLFGDVNGDHLPEISVGRISVLTPEEFQDVIKKIIAHENSGSNRVLLIADRPDNGGDFSSESDAISGLVPLGYSLEKLYLSNYTAVSARQMLLDKINNGVMLINYVGHAGIDRLSKTGFFRTSDLAYLSNRSILPVMVAMTCTVGQFSIPGYDSLSEALVLKKDAGASAVWAPTGLSLSYLAQVLDEGFFAAAFLNNGAALGDLIVNAFRHYSANGGPAYMLDIYNLQGDPAMKMW